MRRRNDGKFVSDDGEDSVSNRDRCGEDEDDEEANEDLSLKILEKALSRRDFDDSKESSMSDLYGSGVVGTVIVNGGKSKGNKKMKITKLEDAHEISIVSKDQDEEQMVEDEQDDDEVERSAEPKPGETSSNMVLNKLLRGARYFDPPDAGWVTCYSCGEQGHITVNCPTPTKRRKPCFICGSLEHGSKQCSKGQDCYVCKKSGHRAKDCPDKYKSGSKAAVCLRCGDFGHDMILCKYEYSQDDLKDIQCYVCKSFGHLCCVEPGNSPSWAVSCYRCGQLGHTGMACGRHYDEITEKESVVSSCFKCGGEGHLKRNCPNLSSLSFAGNSREIASECFRCGEEGHFLRECPYSSSIGTSQGRDSPSLCYKCDRPGHFARECPSLSSIGTAQGRDSPSSCYKCDRPGHFARECPISSEGSKRIRDSSTPSCKPRKKSKENSKHSSRNESSGKMKEKKSQKGEESETTPRKPKHRGGWMTEDPEEDSFQREKILRSPITPSSHKHRLPTTPQSLNHRIHSTSVGHDRKSPSIDSRRHFSGSQSTTPHGRNQRTSLFEPSGHNSGYQQLSYTHNHHQQPYYSQHHQQYRHQDHRYGPAPSRHGQARHDDEFARNYDRY